MSAPRVLILSVGFGQGHHAAAAAMAEEYEARGRAARVVDPCALAYPRFFRLAQGFYRFCVRKAPWLWGITYAQTDTADWSRPSRLPLLGGVQRMLRRLLQEERPDLVLCTYPLYAFMLDDLQAQGVFHGRYAVIVTDALEISRPWVLSQAPLIVVTDEFSQQRLCERYGLMPNRVFVGGFPVRRVFTPARITLPTRTSLRLVYAAYRSVRETAEQVKALLSAYPAAHLTLLGGPRTPCLRCLLAAEEQRGQVVIAESTPCMAALLADSHIYIGKAGAATMFECYASQVPMLINFALPGQEQGNAELLLHDGAGARAESAAELVQTMQHLLANGAAYWQQTRMAMAAAPYGGATARIADELQRRFG